MTDLRDERLDVIAAIDDATQSNERRRANRIRRRVATQMSPWMLGVPAVPFGVVIEDISETGVGIVHSEPLELDRKYLLTVPRKFHGPIIIECTAVRCEPQGHGLWKIGLEASDKIEHVEHTQAEMTVTSRRTKMLFLAFGIIGLAIAAFMPL